MKTKSSWLIGWSLAIAGTMIGSKFCFNDPDWHETFVFLLIAIWFIPMPFFREQPACQKQRVKK